MSAEPASADLYDAVGERIALVLDREIRILRVHPVAGGCINRAIRLQTEGADYFVKLNRPELVSMFEAEAQGLDAITQSGRVRVPGTVCWGDCEAGSFLVLEFMQMSNPSPAAMAGLGECLAEMHRVSSSRFGWHRNNWIGSTPQQNQWCEQWTEFWRERRLLPQLRLARSRGLGADSSRSLDRVLDRSEILFDGYRPVPSLVHGDLWAGNCAACANGEPVIFDPAVYYGDRETDLAMTELFGGFGPGFYQSYRVSWPLDDGYRFRKTLYNLYHVLNHYNLFGGGYGAQAETMAQDLLREIG